MSSENEAEPAASERPPRRPRYSGRNPRRWDQKYKEHGGDAETLAKVAASGKTPAGTHRPIMLEEVMDVLRPAPGETGLDGTLGYGGHAEELLRRIQPGGRLIGLDVDPVQLPATERRLRELGFDSSQLTVRQCNFAGIPKALADLGISGLDFLLVDLGVSSMQIDNPARGFSFKHDGPLDMRMNPGRGQPASAWLERASAPALEKALAENADEPRAAELAGGLAGRHFESTAEFARAIGRLCGAEDADSTVRRVFQAIRIVVNDEFSALDSLLRQLPACLKPGGRAAALTFHSGEDRRVKKAFAAGLAAGEFREVANEVIRASPEEQRANTRAASAKLRWAVRAG